MWWCPYEPTAATLMSTEVPWSLRPEYFLNVWTILETYRLFVGVPVSEWMGFIFYNKSFSNWLLITWYIPLDMLFICWKKKYYLSHFLSETNSLVDLNVCRSKVFKDYRSFKSNCTDYWEVKQRPVDLFFIWFYLISFYFPQERHFLFWTINFCKVNDMMDMRSVIPNLY